jgi:hypothetical protein
MADLLPCCQARALLTRQVCASFHTCRGTYRCDAEGCDGNECSKTGHPAHVGMVG